MPARRVVPAALAAHCGMVRRGMMVPMRCECSELPHVAFNDVSPSSMNNVRCNTRAVVDPQAYGLRATDTLFSGFMLLYRAARNLPLRGDDSGVVDRAALSCLHFMEPHAMRCCINVWCGGSGRVPHVPPRVCAMTYAGLIPPDLRPHVQGYDMHVVSPSRNRAAATVGPSGLVSSPMRPPPMDSALSPARVAPDGVTDRQMISDVLPGTVVYMIRQQCVRAEAARDEGADVEHVDPLPEAMRPAKAVLGVYLHRELAEFYLERALQAVFKQHVATQAQAPEGVSSTPPDGLSEDVWKRLRAAAESSSAPEKVACTQCDLGYKWTYRRWNVVVTVWIQRMAVDLPPVGELW